MTTHKLNRRSQQRLKRLQASVDHLQAMLNRINMIEVEEIIRRDEISIDEYARFGGGSVVLVGRRTANAGSPVENAVIAKMMGKPIRDHFREAVQAIEESIVRAEAHIFEASKSLQALTHPEAVVKERRKSNPCDVCQVLPVMKTGMCHECYTEWIAAGSPERDRWIAYKLHLTNSEGVILITEQPLPRHVPNT